MTKNEKGIMNGQVQEQSLISKTYRHRQKEKRRTGTRKVRERKELSFLLNNYSLYEEESTLNFY
jgi:hypothetical protein